jgi:ABC-type sugar transport system ATPase subunit
MTTAVHRTPDLLKVTGVTKKFGGVKAVNDVSLSFPAGTVTALVGENGAGKSTLMNIIAGIHPSGSFEGTLELVGETAEFSTIRDAEHAGVVLVPQELRIAPELSLAENMFVGHLPRKSPFVDSEKLYEDAQAWLKFFDVRLDPHHPAGLLSPSEQRLATIAAALSRKAKLLILDEPTAAITDGESARLFAFVRQLRDQGIGIVVITHRLDEVEQVADRVLVMRNGALVDELDQVAGNRARIVNSMIGRDLQKTASREVSPAVASAPPALRVRDLVVHDATIQDKIRVDGVSFDLRAGEILGIYGLVGAGRTEMARAIFGSWPGRAEGEVNGSKDLPRSPRHAMRAGLAMVTEDRKSTGLITGHSVGVNMSAATVSKLTRSGIYLDSEGETDRNTDLVRRLDIRPARLDLPIESLSGGNQQKVLLARAIATNPKVLILDEPTLGVDIGARFEIYRLIREMAAQGVGVLLISSDVEEVAAECDRVLVMYKGRFASEHHGETSHHDLVASATGGTHND